MKRLACLAVLSLLASGPLPSAANDDAEEEERQEAAEDAAPGDGAGHSPRADGSSRPQGGAGITQGRADDSRSRSTGGGAGGGGGKSAGGGDAGLPPELRGLRWRVYARLAEVPRPPTYGAAHGFGDMAPNEGIAVGFKTAAAGRNGNCAITESPATRSTGRCTWNAWISATPGGAPLPGNCSTLGIGNGGATVGWMSIPNSHGGSQCGVKPSSTYYCNVTGCRGLIGSPMGVEDYTLAEATALNVGASCNLPGTRALGRLQADGSCKCQDKACEDLNRIYATLPRCTNQVMRAPGATTCLSCASMHPAACGAGNTVVPDCSFACRP